MAYTFHDLKAKTLQELRDIAKDTHHDAVQGFSQMNKDHLLPALCKAFGIDTHEHAEVVGIDKAAIKAQMRTLKARRAEAIAAHDSDALKDVRRRLHGLNRKIRGHVSHSA